MYGGGEDEERIVKLNLISGIVQMFEGSFDGN